MFVRVYRNNPRMDQVYLNECFLLFKGKIKKGLVSTDPGLSCEDIKYSGIYSNGYYWIKPAGSKETFQAYCDMLAVGGT